MSRTLGAKGPVVSSTSPPVESRAGVPGVARKRTSRRRLTREVSPAPDDCAQQQIRPGGRNGDKGDIDQQELPADPELAADHRGREAEDDRQGHGEPPSACGSGDAEGGPDQDSARDGEQLIHEQLPFLSGAPSPEPENRKKARGGAAKRVNPARQH